MGVEGIGDEKVGVGGVIELKVGEVGVGAKGRRVIPKSPDLNRSVFGVSHDRSHLGRPLINNLYGAIIQMDSVERRLSPPEFNPATNYIVIRNPPGRAI